MTPSGKIGAEGSDDSAAKGPESAREEAQDAAGGAPLLADLSVSPPLVVEPEDNLEIATLDLEPGLYIITLGVAGDLPEDPGLLGGINFTVEADPDEVYDGSAGLSGLAVSLGSYSGDPEANSVKPAMQAFFARVDTMLSCKVAAVGSTGGTLTNLTLAAVPIA